MATGREIELAWIKGTTWGSILDPDGVGNGLRCKTVVPLTHKPDKLPDEAAGYTWLYYVDEGNKVFEPVLTGDLRFAGALWKFIALCMGQDTATVVGATADYDHEMLLLDTISTFLSAEAKLGTVRNHQIDSYKPSGFTLTGEVGGFWQFEFRGIASSVTLITAAAFSSVTYLGDEKRVPFNANTKVRIDDFSAGSALEAADIVKPRSMEIRFDRAMEAEFLADGGNNNWKTSEPQENGQPELEITMEFPEYDTYTYLDDLVDGTDKMMDITITGPPTGEDAQTYDITMEFPHLHVMDTDPTIDGANRIPQPIVLQGLYTATAAAGMTSLNKPMRLTLRNQQTADYDA